MDIQIFVRQIPRTALLVFHFAINHCMGHSLQIPDSTQSRDCEEDHTNLPVTATLTIDTYLKVRPQIVLFQKKLF